MAMTELMKVVRIAQHDLGPGTDHDGKSRITVELQSARGRTKVPSLSANLIYPNLSQLFSVSR